jgi:sarcosine oxidase, subunit beta
MMINSNRSAVAIIGGGVIGASIAWHLASFGERDVLVVDRGDGGSTIYATGGFRTQFATAINVRLSLLAREKLRRFADELGVDSGYRPYGYLFLARSEATLRVLREAQAVQHACGVSEATIVDDVRALNPAIDDPRVSGAAWCPTDGFIRPRAIRDGYAADAARRGVRFVQAEVRALRTAGSRVIALETSVGEIAAGVFVNAAGAWAAPFGDVPVVPLRRQVAPTRATDVLPESMPMTIWADDGYHLRVRDGRVLLLWPEDPPMEREAWLARVRAFTDERVPCLRAIPIDAAACWSGLYEMSPDRHAILGRSLAYENLILANGSSGHGVMHAPAIGQLIAELITGRTPAINITPLRASRFAKGEAIAGPALL